MTAISIGHAQMLHPAQDWRRAEGGSAAEIGAARVGNGAQRCGDDVWLADDLLRAAGCGFDGSDGGSVDVQDLREPGRGLEALECRHVEMQLPGPMTVGYQVWQRFSSHSCCGSIARPSPPGWWNRYTQQT